MTMADLMRRMEERAAEIRALDARISQTAAELRAAFGPRAAGMPRADGPRKLRTGAVAPDGRYCVLSLDVATGAWQVLSAVVPPEKAAELLRPADPGRPPRWNPDSRIEWW